MRAKYVSKIVQSKMRESGSVPSRFGGVFLAAALATVSLVAPANAATVATYGFDLFRAAATTSSAPTASQLKVKVSDAGNGQVLFTFFNLTLPGSIAAAIDAIYFDDGNYLDGSGDVVSYFTTLNSIAGFDTSGGNAATGGVAFSKDPSPANLAGAGNAVPDFYATTQLSSDADSPGGINKKSIDVGESLGVLFNLAANINFDKLITAIDNGLLLDDTSTDTEIDQSLRIGLHVKFAAGSSDSYIITERSSLPPTIPLPASVPLLAGALGVLGFLGWRKRALVSAS